jgi:hypothetical protein
MELIATLAGIVAVAWLLTIPARRYEKRTGKKLGRGAAGAGLGVVQELFQPSAANAAVIVEEQREARTPRPAAEDKDFDNNRIVISLPNNSS